jgi:alpha-mannosidase
MHRADIPHGEAVDLDDSSWERVKAPSQGPAYAVWYRAWIEVPKAVNGYDLSGGRVWFRFNIDADGLGPAIVYFNGRRIAMGEDLEPIVLFDPANPGDKILVAVKLGPSWEPKSFESVDLNVDPAPGRPDHSLLWKQMVAIGELQPGAEKELADAAAAVDFESLGRGDQSAFDASLRRAQAALAPLDEQVKKFSIQLTGNSHIDAAWLWPWTETVDVVHRTFGSAVQLMAEYPQLHFAQSSAQYSEWMEEKYPGLFQEMVNRAHEGRWEPVGGMWVEPDLNMPDGESLARQLLLGKRYFQQKFGVGVRIGWNPDSFGYNWQLPQIYKKSGIDYFVTQKMSWNETNQLPLKLFWWKSPDGSRVLAYFPSGYGGEIGPLDLAADLRKGGLLNPGLTQGMHLFGEGDHGGGPTRTTLDRGIRWSRPDVIFPAMRFGTAQEFFSAVEKNLDTEHALVWSYRSVASGKAVLPAPPAGKIELPVWDDELYLEFHRGVFTTQATHKQNMRRSEEELLNAEKYSSLAWLEGEGYPGVQLSEAWKKVLFNQFHDLAAGSGIGAIYKDAQRDYDVVRWTAEEATSKAIRALAGQINTQAGGGVPIVVWNPLAWRRIDLATIDLEMPQVSSRGVMLLDSRGREVLTQALSHNPEARSYRLLARVPDVPALGYTVLHAVPGGRTLPTDLRADGTTLENALLRVKVDPRTGCIVSLYDKQEKFESLASSACGNELTAFQDKPKEFDAWNIDADFEKAPTALETADSVKLIEQGPLRATIQVTRHWQHSRFTQEISLYAGIKRVDVMNDIDWHETHVLLKAAFPLAASGDAATYEIPYGTIDRPTTRRNSWEAAKFEVPAIRWADLGDGRHGFTLINESKYGYDAKGNVLRLSLLRSPTYPDPQADQGHHHFAYSLYPHAGDWKQALSIRRGYEFNYRLKALQVQAHAGKSAAEHSYVSVSPDHVVLTALKKAEDGDGLIVRFYEWAGKSGDVLLKLPEGARSAQPVNLLEEPCGGSLALSHNELKVTVHPYEIVSIRVNYPPRPR